MILAGPGSGKTKVITERVRFLTEEKRIPGEKILVLTFSRAAAEEMRSRYAKLCATSRISVTFGTFHSVFFSILRTLPEYKILSVAERKDQIGALKTGMLNKFGKNVYTSDMLNLVLDDIGRVKNGLKAKLPETKKLYEPYNEELRKKSMIDYDDMLLCILKELGQNQTLLQEIRSRFSFILVDEFQDINHVQYEVVKLLSFPENHLFCVGDDDQSIYGFRGSDPSFMKKMQSDFPKTKVVELTVNYRSTEKIVSVTKKLIEHNKIRFPKHPEAIRKNGVNPIIAKFLSPKEEAEYIVKKVAALSAGETAAVLCRTNRALDDIRDMVPENMKKMISFHTFHTAKGLEFDCVFVAQCNDDVTPGQRFEGKSELEEERRTFYVAATRAKSYLYFLYSELFKDKESKPSRFLKELI